MAKRDKRRGTSPQNLTPHSEKLLRRSTPRTARAGKKPGGSQAEGAGKAPPLARPPADAWPAQKSAWRTLFPDMETRLRARLSPIRLTMGHGPRAGRRLLMMEPESHPWRYRPGAKSWPRRRLVLRAANGQQNELSVIINIK